MDKFYLVLYMTINSPAIAVIPEKYPTEEACHNAANGNGLSMFSRWQHSCIPAPVKNCRFTARAMPTNPAYSETVKVCDD